MTASWVVTPEATHRLRDYQLELLQRLYNSYNTGATALLAYLPTGGGKTRVAIEMMAAAVQRKWRCMFVVNRNALVEQV